MAFERAERTYDPAAYDDDTIVARIYPAGTTEWPWRTTNNFLNFVGIPAITASFSRRRGAQARIQRDADSSQRAEELRPMHQAIHAIVDAQTREDALGVARGSVFDRLVGATREGRREFDYYVTFDQENTTVAGRARWGDLPVAARLNSEEGQDLLARGWNATKAEFERNLQQIREGFAGLSDEQIMADTNFVRHHCANLGAYAGPPIHLYDEFGNGIRTPEDFVFACRDFENPWIVPADVHL